MKYVSLFFLLVSSVTSIYSQKDVKVNTRKGPVIGLRWDPHPPSGASYDAFLGIPYGQKPIRFQFAVPPEAWNTPLVAQEDGPSCPQPAGHLGMPYDEDCLYLNVFTPLNVSGSTSKLPVMAYFHGTAFTWSSSYSKMYGPDFLVTRNIILVTMNFRVGALGFLSLDSPEAPGNLGLHDTVLALQWIQDEISAFGGDPRQVTVSGHSSGGTMAMFHYISPLSTGLFQRAIAMSGTATNKWALVTREEAVRRARELADLLGCGRTPHNNTATVSCMRSVDVRDIIDNQQEVFLSDDSWLTGNCYQFVPVLDTRETSSRPFFNNTLENLMAAALDRAKPILTGFTSDDGIIWFMYEYWRQVEDNLGVYTGQTGELRATLAAKIREQYFPVSKDQNKVQQLVKLYTDYVYAYPVIQVAKYFENFTFGYIFAYDGSWVKTPEYFSRYHLRGVNHADELRYLLFFEVASSQTLDNCTTNQDNINIKNIMVKWWTDFVTNGVPDVSWPKVSQGAYRLIDTTVSTLNRSEVEREHHDIWASIDQASSSSVVFIQTTTLFTLFVACIIFVNDFCL